MLTKHIKRILLIGLILSVLLFVLGCISENFFSTREPTTILPMRVLTINSDKNQRAELANQLEIFSEEHDLELEFKFNTARGFDDSFSFAMYGENLLITGYFEPDFMEIDIGFYEDPQNNLPKPDYLDRIYNDLTAVLSETPGVTVIEKK